MATRRCGACGRELEEAASLRCPSCGPPAVWTVQADDGVTVGVATSEELVIAPQLERALLARPAEVEGMGPVHSFTDLQQLVRRARRGRL